MVAKQGKARDILFRYWLEIISLELIEYANGEKGTKDEKKTFLGKIFAVCLYSKISKKAL